MTNVCFANPASFTIRSTLALPVKWGTWSLPPLIASTSGRVDQTKCLTLASLAARTAAVAWLTSSVPFSQKLVTRNTPFAPSNAAVRVSGRFKPAWMTSSASSLCLAGFRVRARTLNCLLARRARTTAPPCCPVAPTTAISFLSLDDMSQYSCGWTVVDGGRLLSEATVEAQGASAIGQQQQEAAGDRDILEEHDHLDLISEVRVKDECCEQRIAGEQEGGNAGLPADDNRDRTEDFGGDDDRKPRGRYAECGHVAGRRGVGTDLSESGKQEKYRKQTSACEV